jgi:hypothetical protein
LPRISPASFPSRANRGRLIFKLNLALAINGIGVLEPEQSKAETH